MKLLKILRKGLFEAAKVFLLFVVVIVPLNIMFNYADDKDIQAYFTLEFVINFTKLPLIWGLFCLMVILSCINQVVLAKRAST